MKQMCYILLFMCVSTAFGQSEALKSRDSSYAYNGYIIFEGDTVVIELEEVQLLKKLNFENNDDRRYYYWFRKKVLRAYPYAKLAAERLDTLNRRLDAIESKQKRKQYVKRVQKYMEGEFTDQLKKLTRTEGRVLIKLIHRQTGITTYDLIKDMRSGWKAFWYNGTAKLFKLSLKAEYDPEHIDEDFLIEDIIQRAFIDGTLEHQPPKLDFNYHELASERGKTISIPEY